MKIAPRDIAGFLNAPQVKYSTALLYGPDGGLVAERTEQIIKATKTNKQDGFSFVELSEAALLADPALLNDEIASISMLSPKRFILVRAVGDKLVKILSDAFTILHADVFLLVIADELSARSTLRQLFEKQAHAASVACYADSAQDLRQVAAHLFEQAKVQTESGVLEYLTAQLGNDRRVSLSELEKILLWLGDDKKLDLKAVKALVNPNREAPLDELCNAVASRQPELAERLMAQMEREGVQPIMWLRALQRYFSKLLLLGLQMQAGKSVDEVIAAVKPQVFFKQVPILAAQLRMWKPERSMRVLQLLTQAEAQVKSGHVNGMLAARHAILPVLAQR